MNLALPTAFLIFNLFCLSESVETFSLTMGGSRNDYGKSVVETSDGDYVITGYTMSYGTLESRDVLLSKFSMNGSHIWSTAMGASGGTIEEGIAVIETSDGGFIVSGHAAFSFGPGKYDILLSKYNFNGSHNWTTVFGSSADVNDFCGNTVVETSDGGFVLTSDTYESVNYGLVLSKFSSLGSLIWSTKMTRSYSDRGYSVQETSDLGFIVIGVTYGTFGKNVIDLLLAKFNSSGGFEWATAIGGSEDDSGRSVQETSDGGYIVTGFTDSFHDTFDDLILSKFDSLGQHNWTVRLGGPSGDDRGYSVQETLDGGYIVSGYSQSYVSGQGVVALLTKFAEDGNHTWSVTYNRESSSSAFSAIQTSDGDAFVITGYYNGDVLLSRYDPDEHICDVWIEVYPDVSMWEDISIAYLTEENFTVSSWDTITVIEGISPEFRYIEDPELDNNCFTCFGIQPTSTESCSSKGNCTGSDTCLCIDKYFGERCTVISCFGYPAIGSNHTCSGHGNCSSMDICNCDQFFYGVECDVYECGGIMSNNTQFDDIVCSGHGNCTTYDYCECQGSYFGRYCDVHYCDGVLSNDTDRVCLGHGECTDFEHCQCDDDYYGGNCEVNTCDGILSNSSELQVCSALGNCTAYDTCECEEFHFGETCEINICYGLLSNNSDVVCSGRGNCTSLDTCECEETLYGFYCNVTTCWGVFSNTSDVCSGRGSCHTYDTCRCQENYFGEACEVSICQGAMSNSSDTVCSGHGNCTSFDTCQCDELYFGTPCNVTLCDGVYSNESSLVCSGHGSCVEYDKCHCFENYYLGELESCDVTSCNGVFSNDSVCSGHGSCLTFEECQCQADYYGENCKIISCYDVATNVSDPTLLCTGHGDCASPENCSCSEGYIGEECAGWTCKTEPNESPYVCSAHGDCISLNNCTCWDYSAYWGEFCEVWYCYDVISTNIDEVCASHGVCVGHDECQCFSGYESLTYQGVCTEWMCGTKDRDDPEVCSGRGECQASHECECSEDYYGDICELWSCGGVDSLSTATCSGHGTCDEPNTCSCTDGYSGDICSTNLLALVVGIPAGALSLGTFVMCVFCGSLVIGFLLCCLLVCGCLACTLLMIVSGMVSSRQAFRIKKFGKLHNFDLYLQEQEMEEDITIAHLRINNNLFEIPFEEVKMMTILGEGGSNSVVFKATWNGKLVAFKCFKTRTLMTSQDKYDEFEREVEILSSLAHPNIIRFFGACLKPPRIGIIMEYASNGEIFEYIEKFRELSGQCYPLHQKIRMLCEISNAMLFLHTRSIIHRDLKSENVLVDSKEETKLMDFGLSRLVESMSVQKTLRIGTNVYMAPEIINDANYSEKCDVFSFSILCFIIFSERERPYEGYSELNIELRVANDSTFRPDLNKIKEIIDSEEDCVWIEDLISTSWDHSPENRKSFKEISLILQENKGGGDEKGEGSSLVGKKKKDFQVNEKMKNRENEVLVEEGEERVLETKEELKEMLEESRRENEELRKQIEEARKKGFC